MEVWAPAGAAAPTSEKRPAPAASRAFREHKTAHQTGYSERSIRKQRTYPREAGPITKIIGPLKTRRFGRWKSCSCGEGVNTGFWATFLALHSAPAQNSGKVRSGRVPQLALDETPRHVEHRRNLPPGFVRSVQLAETKPVEDALWPPHRLILTALAVLCRADLSRLKLADVRLLAAARPFRSEERRVGKE